MSVRAATSTPHFQSHAEAMRDAATAAFAADVLSGLTGSPKRLSPKYFYDAAGSELFEQITRLPEYYPTRTELGILRDQGAMIDAALPEKAALIEFGAGSSTKARLLLEAKAFGAYVPVDISGEFLNGQAAQLREDLPELPIHPVIADFTEPFTLPPAIEGMAKVGFFPGSTIGNFEPHEASQLMRSMRDILGDGSSLIIGVDLEKAEDILRAAYNDEAGVTAKFDLNLLTRINHELGGTFDLNAFRHRAIYNRERHRIEMHLVSLAAQTVKVLGRTITFRAGETIHTENSYKYSLQRFATLARSSGWRPVSSWTDAAAIFSVHLLRAD